MTAIAFIHPFVSFSSHDISFKGNISDYIEQAESSADSNDGDTHAMRDIIRFANHYAVPTGIFLFMFVILSGLFLFNILADDPDYTLIIPAAASFIFAAFGMTYAQGDLFLPPVISGMFTRGYMIPVTLVLIVIYVILNSKKYFIRYFFYINLTTTAVLLTIYLIHVAQDIYLPDIIKYIIDNFPRSLIFGSFAYYLTGYLLFACFLSAYVYHIGKYAQAVTKTQVLRIQNRLITKNYESMVRNVQKSSTMRHEWKNNIIAMDIMYKQGKTEELGKYIEKLNSELSEFHTTHYTDNFTINAIIINAAEKAREKNVNFRANIYVPKELNISDVDLCSLIINMLDDSIEACNHIPESKKRFIEFNARLNKGFLNISCKNSYSGSVVVSDSDSSAFKTTKINKSGHGFGIKQMNIIAKKYGSLLDISYGNGIFKVQTSLRNKVPSKKASKE